MCDVMYRTARSQGAREERGVYVFEACYSKRSKTTEKNRLTKRILWGGVGRVMFRAVGVDGWWWYWRPELVVTNGILRERVVLWYCRSIEHSPVGYVCYCQRPISLQKQSLEIHMSSPHCRVVLLPTTGAGAA